MAPRPFSNMPASSSSSPFVNGTSTRTAPPRTNSNVSSTANKRRLPPVTAGSFLSTDSGNSIVNRRGHFVRSHSVGNLSIQEFAAPPARANSRHGNLEAAIGKPKTLRELFAQNQQAPGNEGFVGRRAPGRDSKQQPTEKEMRDMLEEANLDMIMLDPANAPQASTSRRRPRTRSFTRRRNNNVLSKLNPNFPCVLQPTRVHKQRQTSSRTTSTGSNTNDDNESQTTTMFRLLSASTPNFNYHHEDDGFDDDQDDVFGIGDIATSNARCPTRTVSGRRSQQKSMDDDSMSLDFSDINWKDRHLDTASTEQTAEKAIDTMKGAGIDKLAAARQELLKLAAKHKSKEEDPALTSPSTKKKKKVKKEIDEDGGEDSPKKSKKKDKTKGKKKKEEARLDDKEELAAYGFTENHCHSCGITNSEIDGFLIQCARCKKAYYCSTKCFNADFAIHQKYCGNTGEVRQFSFSATADRKAAAALRKKTQEKDDNPKADQGDEADVPRTSRRSALTHAPVTPKSSKEKVGSSTPKTPMSEASKKKKKIKLTPADLGLTAEEGKDPVKLQAALKRWKKEQKKAAAAVSDDLSVATGVVDEEESGEGRESRSLSRGRSSRSLSRQKSSRSVSKDSTDDSESRRGRTRSRSRARMREEHEEKEAAAPRAKSVRRRRSLSRAASMSSSDEENPDLRRSRSRSRVRRSVSRDGEEVEKPSRGRGRSVARRAESPDRKERSKSLARVSRRVENAVRGSRSRSKSVPRPVAPPSPESSPKGRRKSLNHAPPSPTKDASSPKVRRKSLKHTPPSPTKEDSPKARRKSLGQQVRRKSEGGSSLDHEETPRDDSPLASSRGRGRELTSSHGRSKSRGRHLRGKSRGRSRATTQESTRRARASSPESDKTDKLDDDAPIESSSTAPKSPSKSPQGARKDIVYDGSEKVKPVPLTSVDDDNEDRRGAFLRQPTGLDAALQSTSEAPSTPLSSARSVGSELTSSSKRAVGRISSKISALTNAFRGGGKIPPILQAPETPNGIGISWRPKTSKSSPSEMSELSPGSTSASVLGKLQGEGCLDSELPYASPLSTPSMPAKRTVDPFSNQRPGQSSVESSRAPESPSRITPTRGRRDSATSASSGVQWAEVDFTSLEGTDSSCSVVRKTSDVSLIRSMFESKNKDVRSKSSEQHRKIKDLSDDNDVREKLKKAGVSMEQLEQLKAAGLKITDV